MIATETDGAAEVFRQTGRLPFDDATAQALAVDLAKNVRDGEFATAWRAALTAMAWAKTPEAVAHCRDTLMALHESALRAHGV